MSKQLTRLTIDKLGLNEMYNAISVTLIESAVSKECVKQC